MTPDISIRLMRSNEYTGLFASLAGKRKWENWPTVWVNVLGHLSRMAKQWRLIKYLALKGEVCCSPDVVVLKGLIPRPKG